jgi:integrase
MTSMRSHGEGSCFQRRSGRGRGRWVAVVTLRDGRRASRTAKTRDEAREQLAELLRLRDARAPVTRNIRLSDYLERWVSDVQRLAPSTRRKHEAAIRVHLVPALGHIRLSELSVGDVESAIRRADVGPQSRRHLRATLRRALADAVRDGLVLRNVAGLARPEHLPASERTILDANQARILIESTKGTTYGPLWCLLVTTGLRISEALGLSWSDVDFGGNDGRTASVVGEGDAGTVGSGGQPGNRERDLGAGGDDGAGRRGVRLESRGVVSQRLEGHPRRGVHRGGGQLRSQPAITVRRQLARENGEWVHRPPKTAKGRRTIPLTALGVEALRAQRTQQREWMAAYYGGRDGDQRPGLLDGGMGHGPHAVPRSGVAGHSRDEVGAERHRRASTGGEPHVPSAAIQPIDGLVFTTSRGRPLHETNTLAALHKALAEAGLPKVSQHSLRHLAATIWYSQGLPIEAIADLLGHSTVRVTQDLYRHHVQEFSVLAAERMQEALSG